MFDNLILLCTQFIYNGPKHASKLNVKPNKTAISDSSS